MQNKKKLDKKMITEISELSSENWTDSEICKIVGISRTTFYKYMSGTTKLEKELQEAYQLSQDLKKRKRIDEVMIDAKDDPMVRRWLLERYYPEEFSLKVIEAKKVAELKSQQKEDEEVEVINITDAL